MQHQHISYQEPVEKMGICASLSKEDVEESPVKPTSQKSVKSSDVVVQIVEDPYTKYGGSYTGDPKDTAAFKYVTFGAMPKFTPGHKSAMAKYLTPEIFEKLKDIKSSKGYSLSNAIMTGMFRNSQTLLMLLCPPDPYTLQ